MKIGSEWKRKNGKQQVLNNSFFVLSCLSTVALFLFSVFLFSSPALGAPAPEVVTPGALAGEASTIPIPMLQLSLTPADSPEDVAVSLQIIALLTVLSLAPAILLMLTSFTRIVVVLGFVQRSIGLQQTPPQQTVVSLALFLTLFTMYPTWNRIYEQGVAPYLAGSINSTQAWTETITPIREFMFRYTRQDELSLMISMSNAERPEVKEDIPTRVLIPAFMLSELKTAFQMGVVIYIPFIVVDMVVSSVLLAMGMMMLPPMMISLPFNILLFVMADGWNLVILSILKSFTNVS
jgi:flagellar biosynthetic protein FliP